MAVNERTKLQTYIKDNPKTTDMDFGLKDQRQGKGLTSLLTTNSILSTNV